MRAPLDPRDVERLVRDLPRAAVSAPEQLWESIRAELAQPGAARGGPIYRRPFHAPLLAAAAVTLAVLGGAAAGVLRMYTPPSHWAVVPLAGSPKVGGQALAGPGDLARGEWLETDARSRARLALGNIGTAQVGPGSRVRLERSGLFEQRLSVQRGSLHAVVSAPPRLFVVETPVVRATDLGCAYTLVVDSTGASRLRVIAGSVELAAGGMVTVVPMGLMLEVDVGGRPGTPPPPTSRPCSPRCAIRKTTSPTAAAVPSRCGTCSSAWCPPTGRPSMRCSPPCIRSLAA
jgi:hypothetical protein